MASSIEGRPYVGTWRLNQRKLVQHTPDALVFVNGEMSVPGCPRCKGKINLQPFITGLSIEAGVDAGGHSGSINLSIPKHHSDSFVRDAQFVLKPGLEIHIYLKGYFPVTDMYHDILEQKVSKGSNQTVGQKFKTEQMGLEDVMNYPYYHCFHGVVTQVDHSYSSGFNTATIQCASMLHFWQYHRISTNASLFGVRPSNSKLRLSLEGNNFVRMTPYEIIYTLFHDTAGAASGVGFALSTKTNQGAKSSVNNQSLFSLNIEYWKRRFDSKMMNLRMHGVSGALLNAAQAAFLGRISTSQSTKILRGRFLGKDQQSRMQSFLSTAKSLGFFSSKNKDLLTYAAKSRPTTKPAEINIGQMQAFATDLSTMGQVNMWEATYQSKLDLARQVTEITGFEFYQDVDGDLVFKPPMYNLDTSESRVYTIEDIDIISLNHSSKEPEVTYMTVKGSHIRNVRGTGLEGEWGVRGQYIDYRLVAQFGWRPGSFDTAYFNNSKSMFFAAINRMDVMNAGINYASVTIPIRPELRPGYPVYIKPMDCFYYLKSMSHSFQFGGQCTTSLQLIAKRAKFFPPGHPDKEGLDSVKLGNMILPPRPLLAKGDDGRPYITGFPNVVMSLDPNQINPLFFVVGADIEDIASPQTITNLVKAAAEMEGLLSKRVENGQTIYFIPGEKEEFYLEGKPKGRPNAIDLKAVARRYGAKQKSHKKQIDSQQTQILKERRILEKLETRRIHLALAKKKNPKAIAKLDAQIKQKEQRVNSLRQALQKYQESNRKELEKDKSIQLLVRLVQKTRSRFMGENKDYYQPNSSTNYLELLSDKKASFSNGHLPGSYRYYSASHPNPSEQGMPELEFSDKSADGVKQNKNILKSPRKIRGFVSNPTTQFPGGSYPDVAFTENHKVERGIKVLTNDPKNPTSIRTTDQIRRLEFAVHKIRKGVVVTSYEFKDTFRGLRGHAISVLSSAFGKQALKDKKATLQSMFEKPWTDISQWKHGKKQLLTGFDGPLYPFASTKSTNKSGQPISSGPSKFSYRGLIIDPSVSVSENLKSNKKPAFYETTFLIAVTDYLSESWKTQSNSALLKYYNSKVKLLRIRAKKKDAKKSDERKAGVATEKFEKILTFIYKLLEGRSASKPNLVEKNSRVIEKKQTIYSPVFPVSDAKGYEVVGTYRYGRDLDLDPQGSMRQLYKMDVMQFADRKAIEDYLDASIGKSISVTLKEGNKSITKKLSGKEAKTQAQRNLSNSVLKNPNARTALAYIAKKSNAKPQNAAQWDVLLRNWIANGLDGINKLPILNAAYSLADLHNHVKKKSCSCRTAEADLLMMAFAEEGFTQISKGLDQNPSDGAAKWQATQIINKSDSWTQHQKAISGEHLDGRNQSLMQTFQQSIAKFQQNTSAFTEGVSSVGDQAKEATQNILLTALTDNESS